MEFKDRIRDLRMKKEMSQTQLAAILNKGDSAIRMWELGKSKPDMDTVLKLCDIFECSIDYLFGRSELLNVEQIKKVSMDSEYITEVVSELSDNLKVKIYDTIKYLASISIMVDDTVANKEDNYKDEEKKFDGLLDFIKYLCAFYGTRYGLYVPEYFKKGDKTTISRIMTAFELIDGIDNLVRDLLNIPEKSELDKQFSKDYMKFKRFWEDQFKKEGNKSAYDNDEQNDIDTQSD